MFKFGQNGRVRYCFKECWVKHSSNKKKIIKMSIALSSATTSASAGHMILTPTQQVGSGWPQRGSNPRPSAPVDLADLREVYRQT